MEKETNRIDKIEKRLEYIESRLNYMGNIALPRIDDSIRKIKYNLRAHKHDGCMTTVPL